uniref:18S rRNA (guanine-N(7))-methyltransferase n=1 Tax=Cyprinus carpio carpio TaxID=630221 RepID=A0A8C0Y0N7_CYPCA
MYIWPYTVSAVVCHVCKCVLVLYLQFYNEQEAKKYSQNSRMIEIQTQMSERAVELLSLPEDQPCYLLDVGCGSGLSGDYLSEAGHYWVGVDISTAMLDVALQRDVEGDLLLGDMGEGLPFRPGMFDGCISISALQWLCNADKKTHSPPKRLYRFFSTLYSSLARGARAVFQIYPENSEQLELITAQAMKAGFTGGMVVDYPNSSKAKKFFLCLFAGVSGVLPKVPFQKYERKVCEEEQGLDHGKEGETPPAGEGCKGRHQVHGSSQETSLLIPRLLHVSVWPSLHVQ